MYTTKFRIYSIQFNSLYIDNKLSLAIWLAGRFSLDSTGVQDQELILKDVCRGPGNWHRKRQSHLFHLILSMGIDGFPACECDFSQYKTL